MQRGRMFQGGADERIDSHSNRCRASLDSAPLLFTAGTGLRRAQRERFIREFVYRTGSFKKLLRKAGRRFCSQA